MRVVKCTPQNVGRKIENGLKRLRERNEEAVLRTAEDGVDIIRLRSPKAFGDLRDSVHATESPIRNVIDAPHAGAVEVGSAPHKPDIDALTEWVKLRGMQGLRRLRSARLHGSTTASQALRVKDMLAQEVAPDGSSPIDAPRLVAERIAKGIEKHGTEPHWFVRDSLPAIAMRLARHLRKAMSK